MCTILPVKLISLTTLVLSIEEEVTIIVDVMIDSVIIPVINMKERLRK